MLRDPDGRRCWTIDYSETANYHLDILPCIVDSGYHILLEKAFSETDMAAADTLALRITDNLEDNYETETNHLNWLKSNPFGYARWFFNRASLDFTKAEFLNEAIQPIPSYSKEKLPLQRVVQILKRHRDMMFDGDEHKPISIIITTLASTAYQKETNIIDTLFNVTSKMRGLVTEKYSLKHGKMVWWVENPVNNEENFADKWVDHPEREKNFFDWIERVQKDLTEATAQAGMHKIQESFEKSMGSTLVRKTFSDIGDRARLLTEQGQNRIDVKTGLTSLGTAVIKPHDFYGE
jgi:hypothetical protein